MEALCGKLAEEYVNENLLLLDKLKEALKNPKDIQKAVENLQAENVDLKKHLEAMEARQLVDIRNELYKRRNYQRGEFCR